ncbi:MAG TPA: Lrp/AsnC family transcriptional regulator [Ignisphaera aggregans]|uniref:Lrp/AsnC family transcriptional regulator n=1 Tax=Ignisphaera aggregans TaxID=334771 RepID=A0A833DUM2_9CREN|nr:Lrp/AsnC family transcriptional regulator [Ignisphaera aggregans]
MPKAIVLINTDVGMEEEVSKALTQIPEVREVHIVYGVYDIVAIIEASTFDALRAVIVNRIRRLPHIKSTTTLIVVER